MTNELTTALQFNVDFKASEITIQNETQLAEMVDSAVSHYSTMVLLMKTFQKQKARADLNKVATLLDDQRKVVKNQYNKPLKDFEKNKKYMSQIEDVSDEINQ